MAIRALEQPPRTPSIHGGHIYGFVVGEGVGVKSRKLASVLRDASALHVIGAHGKDAMERGSGRFRVWRSQHKLNYARDKHADGVMIKAALS